MTDGNSSHCTPPTLTEARRAPCDETEYDWCRESAYVAAAVSEGEDRAPPFSRGRLFDHGGKADQAAYRRRKDFDFCILPTLPFRRDLAVDYYFGQCRLICRWLPGSSGTRTTQ